MSSKSWESSSVIGVLLPIPCSPCCEIIVQGWSCVCPQILGLGNWTQVDIFPPVFLVWFLASCIL